MKTGLGALGYTIVEVLIVLAVTSALLVSGLLVVGGQQQKAEFTQSTRDIQSKINEVINHVASGYYARITDFSCNKQNDGPHFDTGSAARGTSQDCILVGRAIQFGINSDRSVYNILNLAGLQIDSLWDPDVPPIDHTLPVAMSPDTTPSNYFPGGLTDTAESNKLSNGLLIKYMYYTDSSGGKKSTSVVAFVTDFPEQTNDGLDSGSRQVNLYGIDTTATGTSVGTGWKPLNSQTDVVDKIDRHGGSPYSAVNFTATKSVVICFEGGGGNSAKLTIGGSGQLAANLQIESGHCL